MQMINNFSNEISDLLLSKLGIHIAADKIENYLGVVRKNSTLIKKLSESKYIEYLLSNSTTENAEWGILIQALNISETYFLRDTGQFEILEKNILPTILKNNASSKKIRIWSAGCSTGEEPYSISILLNELFPNLIDWDISILATDINGNSIKKAIIGDYHDWSFRGVPEEKMQKYFSKRKDIFSVNQIIRKHVRFSENNLFSTAYYKEFDLVLCRNVFIYFDDASKKIILDKFSNALVNNGYLLIGHSEASHLIPDSFEKIQHEKSTVYKKQEQLLPATEKVREIKSDSKPTSRPFISQKKIEPNLPLERNDEIEKAQELTNRGQISEAISIINKILEKSPSNHEALYLKGQIMEAEEKWDAAIALYKKVIYLKPDFLETYLTLSNLYYSIHNFQESKKIKNAGLSKLAGNQALMQIYKEKKYDIESLESFFKSDSGLWL